MPNNTSCHLIVRGNHSDIESLKSQHIAEETINFSSIIEMPEALKNTTEDSARMFGKELMENNVSARKRIFSIAKEKGVYVDDENMSHGDLMALALDVNPEIVFEGLDAMRCLEEYGASSWYDWSINNWGTKWDAYDGAYELTPDPEKDQSVMDMYFYTAWSPASPVISALAEKYPNVEFTHHFLDEGGGFAGTEVYANGMLVSDTEHDWAWFAESHFGVELSDEDDDE